MLLIINITSVVCVYELYDIPFQQQIHLGHLQNINLWFPKCVRIYSADFQLSTVSLRALSITMYML